MRAPARPKGPGRILRVSDLRIWLILVALIFAGWSIFGPISGDDADAPAAAPDGATPSKPNETPRAVPHVAPWGSSLRGAGSFLHGSELNPSSKELIRSIVREEIRAALANTHHKDAVGTMGAAGGALSPGQLVPMRRAAGGPGDTSGGEAGRERVSSGGSKGTNRKIHVVITADSNDYMTWQMRVAYYWYRKAAAEPGSAFGGFTRILHTGEPDHLMDEIPTVVVEKGPKPDPGAPPIQRPNAVIKWLEQAWPEEDYVLMLEPDHVLLRSVPTGNASLGHPVAFLFTYVSPKDFQEELRPHLERAGCAAEDVPRTGNSPSLLHKEDLKRIAPAWSDYSIALHGDEKVRKAVGWVGEMYGFSIAACSLGMKFELQELPFMIHPPFDQEVGDTQIIHYTYGIELMANGSNAFPDKVPSELRVWKFDKRSFKAPGPIPDPPAGAFPAAVRLVGAINEALAATFPPAKGNGTDEE